MDGATSPLPFDGPSPKRNGSGKKRPFLSGVRLSLLTVLVAGCAFGILTHRAAVQRRAVSAINASGGRVWYSWEWSKGSPVDGANPPAPRWLVDLVGIDHFGSVVAARVGHDGTDETLAHVGQLSQLEMLGISPKNDWKNRQSRITGVGLDHLKGLREISQLTIHTCNLSDADLISFEGMTKLKYLFCFGKTATWEGFKRLKRKIPGLRVSAAHGFF